MNPTVITYVGLAVAASILVWSSVTIVQHTRARKKPPVREFDSWIIIRPLSSSDEDDDAIEESLILSWMRIYVGSKAAITPEARNCGNLPRRRSISHSISCEQTKVDENSYPEKSQTLHR